MNSKHSFFLQQKRHRKVHVGEVGHPGGERDGPVGERVYPRRGGAEEGGQPRLCVPRPRQHHPGD